MVVKHFFVSYHCAFYKVLHVRIVIVLSTFWLSLNNHWISAQSIYHCAAMTFYGKCGTLYITGV
jgi:hypothetical protein